MRRQGLNRRAFPGGSAAVGLAPGMARAASPETIAVISDLNGSYGATDYGGEVHGAVRPIRALDRPGDLHRRHGGGPEDRPATDRGADRRDVGGVPRGGDPPPGRGAHPHAGHPGNHDASAYKGFEAERRAFDRTWADNAPRVALLDGERYPFRYAASHQGVLSIGLDITVTGSLPAEEMEWLDAILRDEVTRHGMRLVFGHLPIWPVAQGRQSGIIGDPDFLALLAGHQVNAYLSGHHQACYPARRDGVLLLAQACRGAGPRKYLGGGRSERGFGFLAWTNGSAMDVGSRRAPDFSAPMDPSRLPKRIGQGAARIDLTEPQ